MPDYDVATIQEKHPDYVDAAYDWTLMRDVLGGERKVKEQGEIYLPMPSGFGFQDDGGVAMYQAYCLRARFPDVVRPMQRSMVGVMHQQAATVTIPKALEPLIERATAEGLSLDGFHRSITRELLSTGRFAIRSTVRLEGTNAVPLLAGYIAENIINWDGERRFYVLAEPYLERDGFKWKEVKRYRVLELDKGVLTVKVFDDRDGVFGEVSDVVQPILKGGKALDIMPCAIVGAFGLDDAPSDVPMIGIAGAALSAYRLDADYRHQLFNTAQETLVIKGVNQSDEKKAPKVFGSGAMIFLPEGGDASFVGPAGVSIAAHRTAIQDDLTSLDRLGAALFQQRGEGVESGEAKQSRHREQSASLIDIAIASAECLEFGLRSLARWWGDDPDKVSVKPHLDFLETQMAADLITALSGLRMGGSISKLTLYENLQRGRVANPERTFEEEQDLIDAEMPDDITTPPPPPGRGGGGSEGEDRDDVTGGEDGDGNGNAE